MNPNGLQGFTIKPIQINLKPISYQAWLSSPKQNQHIKLIRECQSPFQQKHLISNIYMLNNYKNNNNSI